MELIITNGDYFNDYFEKTYQKNAIPFRECMMMGNAKMQVFSEEFINLRAKQLSVTPYEYVDKNFSLLKLKENIQNYQSVSLWFGKDSFCQINLLTVLAYLEQLNCRVNITLNLIDDETFEVLESGISVKLGIYSGLYEKIVINKSSELDNYGVICQNAVRLYFDYLSPDGNLASIVKENRLKDKTWLINKLITVSRDYGLSVEMAEFLIGKLTT